MLNQLISILEENSKLSGWRIHETSTISEELFFIKEAIDMNRSKTVNYFNLTVYVDIQEGDDLYTGVANGRIHPTMSVEAMTEAVEDLVFSAKFAKNRQFELVESSDNSIKADVGALKDAHLSVTADNMVKAIFGAKVEGSELNSFEVFANKAYHRVVNSKGVDVSYINDENVVEIITESSGKEEVELFELYHFAGEKGEEIGQLAKDQLEVTKYRAIAEKMPEIKDVNVILRAMDVKELLEYYINKSNASLVYDHLSDYKVKEYVQGDDIKGDKLNITLKPMLENSSKKAPVDTDGFVLKDVEIIKEGQLLTYHGSKQYASYLGVEPTGSIPNGVIEGGSVAYDDMKKEPYLEILSFSAFQANPFNGEFGGEIRLARYFDGKETHYFNGGALSADIKKVQVDMYLSKEVVQIDNYKGPKSLMFKGSIASA